MFFYLSKILAFLLKPLSWVLAILLVALVIRNRKLRLRLLITAFVTLYFFSNPFIADEFVRLWEVPVVEDISLEAQYDIGIVLGGGMITTDHLINRLTFRDNVDRIMQAVRLYKDGRINKIFISGGSGSLVYPDMIESMLLKEYFVGIGLEEDDIVVENRSDNTYQNAKYTTELILSQNPESSCLLITSSIHMRRAKACFDKLDFQVATFPTNKITGERRYQFSHLFLPDLESLRKWDALLHEIFGFLVYKIMRYA